MLTGGACASLYTRGAYQSVDVDFVLAGTVRQARLDAAMEDVGFARRRDCYVHPRKPFYVEFPSGPLAIGEDLRIQPILKRSGRRATLALSATDSCRDRLAAFYHWKDRQSLQVAIQIAMNNRVSMAKVRSWSLKEGARAQFEEFRRLLAGTRKAARER